MSEVENADQTDVDVSELSDEQLNESVVEETEAAEGEESPVVTDENQAIDESQVDNTGEEAGVEDKAESSESSPVIETEEQATVPMAEFEKLQKQVTQQEEFIQKRNTEFGEMKKRERELQDLASMRPNDEALREKFDLDPVGAIKDMRTAERAEEERVQLQGKIHQLEAEQTIKRAIPNFNELKDDIVALAKSDGLVEKDIVDLQNNPYLFNPQDVIGLARRTLDAKRIQTLEDSIKSLSTSKQNMAKNIARAANSSRTITAGSGQATPSNLDISKQQLSEISDAELEELLKED